MQSSHQAYRIRSQIRNIAFEAYGTFLVLSKLQIYFNCKALIFSGRASVRFAYFYKYKNYKQNIEKPLVPHSHKPHVQRTHIHTHKT